MAEDKQDVILSNIDAKNRIANEIINQRYNKHPLDVLKNRIQKIKEDEAVKGAVEDGQLVGIMLWSKVITFTQFRKKYENITSFYREITDKGSNSSDTEFVREVYVHIPEMTTMLPYPNFNVIDKYMNYFNPDVNFSQQTAKFKEAEKECEKEFRKIVMFPRFYEVVSAPGRLPGSYNQPCLVQSLSGNGLSTEGLGKFIKQIDQ
tara:strand:+ start:1556 stop:2170 length:615 start_codon:yes stop_codon:yes gene_type:complete